MDYIEIDQYTAVKLEDGGQYGWKIIEGFVGRDGDFKPGFCKRKFGGKDAPEKVAPVSVKLGTKDQAVASLKLMLAQLDDEPF